jgi:hypothetical protein
VDIYCPSNAATEFLWVNCNGPHACVNVSVYSSISANVVCRGRQGACENVNFYCGDVSSLLEGSSDQSLFTSTDGQSVSPINCKFRHLAPHVTQNSYFGCYGDDIEECKSTAIVDYAYSGSQMYCDTNTDSSCNMICLSDYSCTDNEIECTSANADHCHCQPESNCNEVVLKTESDDSPAADHNSVSYEENVGNSSLKPWQLALAIVLPSLSAILCCILVAFGIPRWRKWSNVSEHRPFEDSGNQSLPAQSTGENETRHNKSVSAESVNGTFKPPVLNTSVEGDKV